MWSVDRWRWSADPRPSWAERPDRGPASASAAWSGNAGSGGGGAGGAPSARSPGAREPLWLSSWSSSAGSATAAAGTRSSSENHGALTGVRSASGGHPIPCRAQRRGCHLRRARPPRRRLAGPPTSFPRMAHQAFRARLEIRDPLVNPQRFAHAEHFNQRHNERAFLRHPTRFGRGVVVRAAERRFR